MMIFDQPTYVRHSTKCCLPVLFCFCKETSCKLCFQHYDSFVSELFTYHKLCFEPSNSWDVMGSNHLSGPII